MKVLITGYDLSIKNLVDVARNGYKVELSEDSINKIGNKNLVVIYNKKDLIKQIETDFRFKKGISIIQTSINLKKIKGADNNLRTLIELPHGNGKKIRVGLLCDENKLDELFSISIPILKKLNDAVFAATTLAVTIEPVIIGPAPPTTFATINEFAFTDVFLNSKVHPVSAATVDCN